MRAGSISAIVIALVAAAVAGLSAHRRDELLQAARVALESNRVVIELSLTPGIEVADAVLADADRNRDGTFSADESWTYCRRVVAATELQVDGRPVPLVPLACSFADLDAMRKGQGTIELRSAADVPRMSIGDHQVLFRNRFQPEVSVYLANALVPVSARVAVRAQHRDADQRSLAIDYSVRPGGTPELPLWPLGVVGGGALTLMLIVRRELVTTTR